MVCSVGGIVSVPVQVFGGGAQEASTIHAFLGSMGSIGFRYHAGNPVSCDVLIVDESSIDSLHPCSPPRTAHRIRTLPMTSSSSSASPSFASDTL